MTQQEAEQIEKGLTELIMPIHSDIKTEVQWTKGKDTINVMFFWNKQSAENWKEAKSFKFKSSDYNEVLESKIIPYFK